MEQTTRREFIVDGLIAAVALFLGSCRQEWQPVFDINQYLSKESIDAVVSSSGRYLATDKIIYQNGKGYKTTEKVALIDIIERRMYNLTQNACLLSVADNGSVLYYTKSENAENGPMLYRLNKPVLEFRDPNWQISDSKLSQNGQVIGLTNNKGFLLLDANTQKQKLKEEGMLMAISGDGKIVIYRIPYEPEIREKAYSYIILDREEGNSFEIMTVLPTRRTEFRSIKTDFMLSYAGDAFVISDSCASGRTDLNVHRVVRGDACAPIIGYDISPTIEGINSLRQIIRVDDNGDVHTADGREIKFVARHH